MNKPLIDISNLSYSYKVGSKNLQAVKDLSFTLLEGETLGLVGESGCGKTTVAKLLLNILKPKSGKISHNLKRQEIQMVYQDPYSSINPRMTIDEIISEPLIIYSLGNRKEREKRLFELLELVGLESSFANRYPHQLSGGQRQRVVIARALAPNPKFLICDEPIAALDVSIQAQIINLLQDLQQELGLTYLFISHDLSIVKYLCQKVAVMYLGEIVEIADSLELYANPLHPYTSALISSIPSGDLDKQINKNRILLKGELPSPFEVFKGCSFASGCPKALDLCRNRKPPKNVPRIDHMTRCHLYNQNKDSCELEKSSSYSSFSESASELFSGADS